MRVSVPVDLRLPRRNTENRNWFFIVKKAFLPLTKVLQGVKFLSFLTPIVEDYFDAGV